jgi:hypothetical protein
MNWEKVRQAEYVRSFNPDLNTVRLTSTVGVMDRVTRKLKEHVDCAACGDTVLATTNAKFWFKSKRYTHMECYL